MSNFTAFSEFLFASIGEEPNGMSLSLLSGLARLGVDPWAEAQRLADMPEAMAVAALAALLVRALATAEAAALADTRTLAARLLQKLPRGADVVPDKQRSTGLAGTWRIRLSTDALRWWGVIIALAVMLFTTFFL